MTTVDEKRLVTLGIKVDAEGLLETTADFERLVLAAPEVKKAIDELKGASHGGISIAIAGNLAHVEVKPQ